MAPDERDFFANRTVTRADHLTCRRCKRANDYHRFEIPSPQPSAFIWQGTPEMPGQNT
jgi:hypothetical protein